MHVVWVFALIKFKYKKTTYPCVVIKWFSATNNTPCPDTGMWIVERDQDDEYDIIHLDTIVCAAHLMGIAGTSSIPRDFDFSHMLTGFNSFYVNRFIDYHAYEIAF